MAETHRCEAGILIPFHLTFHSTSLVWVQFLLPCEHVCTSTCVFCKCVRMLACSCRPPGATLVFPVNL